MRPFIPLPVRVPSIVKWLYPSWYIWDKPSTKKVLYLTFDDGPVPEVTEWVLDILLRKRIKATFFCIGDNVRKYPAIFNRLLTEGHSVGNHTYNHLKGWVTDNQTYLKNTQLAELAMSNASNANTPMLNFSLFRPPYGKIKRSQANALRKRGYQIILYRTLAYDWDPTISKELCLDNVINKAQSGDLIVFHDSVKAFEKLQYALPKVIDYFTNKGYTFERL